MLPLLNRRVAAWSLAVFSSTTVSANAGLLPERVENAAQERIAAGIYQTLVFGVVDGDKSEVVAFGRLSDGKQPDGNTVYEIGSITKTFTATLLAQAVLSGRVTLDTPVAQLLLDFKIPSRGGKEITLGELATQHSGLPREPSNFLPKDPANRFAGYDAAKLKAFLAGYELRRDPGAAYEYSNLGFGLLGYALAQLNHTTYRAMTEEEILRPLGMTMSNTVFTEPMFAHIASGHLYMGAAAKNWDFDALAGAGAIRSTANDMLRYLKANMGVDGSPLVAAMKLAQQPRSNMSRTMRIGLAWMTTNRGIVWHDGWTGGYRSFLGFTARRRGVVILANTATDADDLGFATLDATAPLKPYKAIVPPKEIELDAATLGDCVGTYRFNSSAVVDFTLKGDHLEAQITGQLAFPIFASAKDRFFYKIVDAHLDFERDAGGKVVAVVLHQNGRYIRADRVATEQ